MDIKTCDICGEVISQKYYVFGFIEVGNPHILDQNVKTVDNFINFIMGNSVKNGIRQKAKAWEMCEECKKCWMEYYAKRKQKLYRLQEDFKNIIKDWEKE